MNSPHYEEVIWHLYSPINTSPLFHPNNSEWVNVTSFTYHPHANECGPRSLLAAAMMALHPNPSQHMLPPFMHHNLAQTSRWWVAKTIITESLDPFPLMCDVSITSPLISTSSLHRESKPSNIAPLPTVFSPELVSDMADNTSFHELDQTPPSVPQLSPTTKWQTMIKTTTVHKLSPHSSSTKHLQTIIPPSIKENVYNPQKQSSIKQWTIHHPFIPNISLPSNNEHNTSAPSHPHQHFTAHLEPFGTPLPVIDSTRFLRVCTQNTQHNFKLHGDGLEIHNIINNLLMLGTSMFVPISPNVN